MAWIESHQELKDHPKTEHLAVLLGVPKVQVIGHLHCLWWWAVDYARDGYVTKYPPAVVARGALWDGDPDAFMNALREAKWLDPDGKLHDWEEYAGRLIEQREKAKERYRKWKAARSQPDANAQATRSQRAGDAQSLRKNEVTIPNQPNQPNQQDHDLPPPGDPPPSKPKRARRRGSGNLVLDVLHEIQEARPARDEQVEAWVGYYLQRHPRPGATKEELFDIAVKAYSEFSALKAAGATDAKFKAATDAAPAAAMPWDITKTYRRLFQNGANAMHLKDGGPLAFD